MGEGGLGTRLQVPISKAIILLLWRADTWKNHGTQKREFILFQPRSPITTTVITTCYGRGSSQLEGTVYVYMKQSYTPWINFILNAYNTADIFWQNAFAYVFFLCVLLKRIFIFYSCILLWHMTTGSDTLKNMKCQPNHIHLPLQERCRGYCRLETTYID